MKGGRVCVVRGSCVDVKEGKGRNAVRDLVMEAAHLVVNCN